MGFFKVGLVAIGIVVFSIAVACLITLEVTNAGEQTSVLVKIENQEQEKIILYSDREVDCISLMDTPFDGNIKILTAKVHRPSNIWIKYDANQFLLKWLSEKMISSYPNFVVEN
jgi:hypothetical protein